MNAAPTSRPVDAHPPHHDGVPLDVDRQPRVEGADDGVAPGAADEEERAVVRERLPLREELRVAHHGVLHGHPPADLRPTAARPPRWRAPPAGRTRRRRTGAARGRRRGWARSARRASRARRARPVRRTTPPSRRCGGERCRLPSSNTSDVPSMRTVTGPWPVPSCASRSRWSAATPSVFTESVCRRDGLRDDLAPRVRAERARRRAPTRRRRPGDASSGTSPRPGARRACAGGATWPP